MIRIDIWWVFYDYAHFHRTSNHRFQQVEECLAFLQEIESRVALPVQWHPATSLRPRSSVAQLQCFKRKNEENEWNSMTNQIY